MTSLDAKIEALDIHSGHDDHAGRVWIGDEHYSPEEAREIARFLVQVADDADEHDEDDGPTVRQTLCEWCGLDVEGFSDEPTVWRDRGGNTFCGDAGVPHSASHA